MLAGMMKGFLSSMLVGLVSPIQKYFCNILSIHVKDGMQQFFLSSRDTKNVTLLIRVLVYTEKTLTNEHLD